MRELSIFVDESGTQEATSEYYLVTLVFHDQRVALASYFDILMHTGNRSDFAICQTSPSTPLPSCAQTTIIQASTPASGTG